MNVTADQVIAQALSNMPFCRRILLGQDVNAILAEIGWVISTGELQRFSDSLRISKSLSGAELLTTVYNYLTEETRPQPPPPLPPVPWSTSL